MYWDDTSKDYKGSGDLADIVCGSYGGNLEDLWEEGSIHECGFFDFLR